MATMLATASFARRLEVDLVTKSVVLERLAGGVVAAGKRQETIRGLFDQAGCVPDEQRISKKVANVICLFFSSVGPSGLASVRKKINGIFCGGGSSAILLYLI